MFLEYNIQYILFVLRRFFGAPVKERCRHSSCSDYLISASRQIEKNGSLPKTFLLIRQEKRAQRLTFGVRRPPGRGGGLPRDFHAKGWRSEGLCPPSKVWVWKGGTWDVPGILLVGVFKNFVQTKGLGSFLCQISFAPGRDFPEVRLGGPCSSSGKSLHQGLVHTRVRRRKENCAFPGFSAYFCSLEASRAISKPTSNPGMHQTPVRTLSESASWQVSKGGSFLLTIGVFACS